MKCSPAVRIVTCSAIHCTARSGAKLLRMWSTSSSVPPGASTRHISAIAVAGSGIVHSDNAHSTVSNEPSANGRLCASPSRRSAARPRSAARFRAMASIPVLSSIPVIVASGP